MKKFKKTRKKDFYNVYFSNTVLMMLVTFIVVFTIMFVLAFFVYSVAFRNAEFYNEGVFDSIKVNPIFYNALSLAFFPSVFITVGIWYFKGGSVVSLAMPDNMKRQTQSEYDDEMKRRYGANNKTIRVVIAVILILFALFDFVVSFGGIGYYDDYVKFSDSSSFKIVNIEYENLNIYKVQYDDKKPVENAYIISDDNGNYYNYGEIDPNGETQQKLYEIAEKYGKEIIEVESIDYIPLGD